MVKCHAFIILAQNYNFFISGDIFCGLRSICAQVAARTLRIRGKGIFPVMTGAAIFSLIKRLHRKVFILLRLQRFHGKQTAVTGIAGDVFLRMILMAKNYRLNRFGVKDAARRFLSCAQAQGWRKGNQNKN